MAVNVQPAALPDTDLVSVGYYPVLTEAHDEKLDLDEADLRRIIQLNNQRYEETGDMTPLVVGHTDDALPETEQPPIVGYARNYRFTMLGKENPLPAIEAEILVPPNQLGLLKRFPRRSIELHADGLIDPIALLGASTPHLNLGLMLSKDKKSRRIEFKTPPLRKNPLRKLAAEPTPAAPSKQPTNAETQMDEEKLVKLFNQCLESSEVGQYVRKMMEEDAADLEDDDAEEHLDAADGDGNTPPAAMAEAAPAPPAGGSTHVPELGDEKDKAGKKLRKNKGKPAAKPAADPRLQLERDQLAIEVAQLRRVAEDSARKIRLSERSAALKQLVYEGYQFDAAAELEDVADLDEKQWTKHLARMKKNYARVSLGRTPIASGQMSAPAKGDDDLIKLSAKAKEYCIKNKRTDFANVLADAQAGRLKL